MPHTGKTPLEAPCHAALVASPALYRECQLPVPLAWLLLLFNRCLKGLLVIDALTLSRDLETLLR